MQRACQLESSAISGYSGLDRTEMTTAVIRSRRLGSFRSGEGAAAEADTLTNEEHPQADDELIRLGETHLDVEVPIARNRIDPAAPPVAVSVVSQ